MRKGVPLTDAEITALLDALAQTDGNQRAAGRILGVSNTVVQRRMDTARRRGRLTQDIEAQWSKHVNQERADGPISKRLPQTADECWDVLDDFIGKAAVRKPRTYVRDSRKANGPRRIVIASDFHAPFHDPWAVAELIAREATQTDTLIIAGDFTDSYSCSRFVRYEPITAESEWAACDALLGQLSAAFPEVVCIQGNHDARLERLLRSQLSQDVMYAIEQLTGGVLDPFRAIAKRYKNVSFLSHQVGRHGVGWFAQIGDILVSHAEKFSRVPGAALRVLEEWFRDQHDTLNLKPWRVLAQAHTHQLSAVYWGSDKLLVETACLCTTHGYQLQAKVGGRPQRRGYIRLQMTDGVTDINSVRSVWLDPERARVA